jgi:hypothetical protein
MRAGYDALMLSFVQPTVLFWYLIPNKALMDAQYSMLMQEIAICSRLTPNSYSQARALLSNNTEVFSVINATSRVAHGEDPVTQGWMKIISSYKTLVYEYSSQNGTT